MKASEALLRAIASAGGVIPATQLDDWMSQLLKSGFIQKGETPFTYELTESSKKWLRGKGVEV